MAAIMTSYGSMASLGEMLVMTGVRPLSLVSSPHRVCAISTNPGRGHGDLWSVIDWGGIHSHGGAAGTSALVVTHVAVTVGWLWVTDRDTLRQGLLLWVQLFGVVVVQPSLTMAQLFPSIQMVP